MKKTLLSFLVIGILLLAACASPAVTHTVTTTTTTTPAAAPTLTVTSTTTSIITVTTTPTVTTTSLIATKTPETPTTTTPPITTTTTEPPMPTTTPPVTTTTTTTTIQGNASILSHRSYIQHGSWREIFSGKVYEGDFLHIVGEVQNDGQVNVDSYSIEVSCFDSNGIALPTTGPFHLEHSPGLLTPGEKGPFLLVLLDEEASNKTASYELSLQFSVTTEQPYNLNIMGDRDYVNRWGSYTVIGEVENAGESNIESVKIYATFYDEQGMVLDLDYTYTSVNGLRTLVPGQRSPFHLYTSRSELEGMVKGYSLRAECHVTDKEVYRDFQILNHSSSIGILDDYIVKGQIKNTGNQDATFVKIVATFYRADNTVSAYDYTFSDPIDLKAGDIGQFELSTYGQFVVEPDEIVSYSLEFECS